MKLLSLDRLTIFVSLLTMLTLVSCNKEEALPTLTFQNNLDTLHRISSNFTNDMAVFKDALEMQSFVRNFFALETDAREEFTKSLGYKTRAQLVFDLYTEIDGIEDRESLNRFLDQHKDILEIEKWDDGDERIIEKSESKHSISRFLNKDGILKVGEQYQKYLLDYAVYSNNYKDLINITDWNSLSRSQFKYDIVVKSIPADLGNDLRNDLNVTHYEEISIENGSCKNHRRGYFELKMTDDTYTDYLGNTVYEFTRRAKVEAWKKGIICIWYKYSTLITWNNCDFQGYFVVNGSNVNYSFVYANGSVTNQSYDRSGLASVMAPPSGTPPITFFWTKKRTSATTGGLAGQWIESY